MISEPDQIINLISSLLAFFLFVLSLLAYLREHRKKMFFVFAAFFFYSIREFLNASGIFLPAMSDYLEIWGSVLNFLVLLLFSLAVFTKE